MSAEPRPRCQATPGERPSPGWVVETLQGWRFPSFMLFALTFVQLILLGVLLTPPAPTGLGAFAESFKVWCFGYDPATGRMEWIYPVMLLVNPLMLDAVIVAVWWIPLRETLREQPRRLWKSAAAAGLLALVFAGTITLFEPVRPEGELPFPAEALRTRLDPPDFDLIDHEGRPISLASLRGRVVVVTAVYASCGFTCPMIMGQSKRAVEALPADLREDLTVVGITLDATRDTPEVLARMAAGQGVEAPRFRLATGDPAAVERALDRFNVARSRNPETGVIDHANLFLLIDREGKLAYRLSLGDQQERWLITALDLLLREARPLAARG